MGSDNQNVAPDKWKVEVLTDLAPRRFTLTHEEASRLHNDIAYVLRFMGVDFAGHRDKEDLPMLYALYDALYAAGVT